MTTANLDTVDIQKRAFLDEHHISATTAAKIFNGQNKIGGLSSDQIEKIRTDMTTLSLSFAAPANGTSTLQKGNTLNGSASPNPSASAPQNGAARGHTTNGTPKPPATTEQRVQPSTFAEIAQAVPGVDVGKLRYHAKGKAKIPQGLLTQIHDAVGGEDNFTIIVMFELNLV